MDLQLIQNDDGNFDITPHVALDYRIRSSVITRLFSQLGDWWANAQLGSKLHTLGRHRWDDSTVQAVKEYCEDALKPLVESGRAQSISVDVRQDSPDGLVVNVLVDEDTPQRFQVRA